MLKAALVAGPVALMAVAYITVVWIIQRVNARKKRAARRQRYSPANRQVVHS